MKSKSKLLTFILSDDFDEYVLDKVIEKKKATVKEYLWNKKIVGDDNDVRFTAHDMNKAKVMYLDDLVKELLEEARKINHSTYSQDNKTYELYHNKINNKKKLLEERL